jgi:hypothetical protein
VRHAHVRKEAKDLQYTDQRRAHEQQHIKSSFCAHLAIQWLYVLGINPQLGWPDTLHPSLAACLLFRAMLSAARSLNCRSAHLIIQWLRILGVNHECI